MSKFKFRKVVPEIIDDFNWSGNELQQTLHEIEWINKYLGGINTSVYPILHYIQKNLKKEITIADIGCGSGDLLKKIQVDCNGIKKITLIGVDANDHIIEFAKEKHFSNQEILFIHSDIITHPEKIPAANVYMLNLFLHHFEEKEINTIINNLLNAKPQLIVINDLHRSKLAYILFSLLCKIKNSSQATKNDGSLSICKGFNKIELKKIADNIHNYQYKLNWHWAFRWQLVLKRN